ncbi:MAG: creatinine amidohydrolase [Solirubrobacteraceae bacterium]|jgi:creatinine amidohydrolase|nr:creatinine amidohydrolase [Solirubrobacteraceae bacterium]
MNDPSWSRLTLRGVGRAAAAGAVAVLPVGATEQHGPHLATGADTIFAETVALAAARRTGDVVLPALPYGCSLGHTDQWPGTLSLTPATLMAVVREIGTWVHASGFRRFVMVNGHATNGPPCQSALLQLRHDFPDLRMRFVSLFDLSDAIAARYAEDAPDFHANEAETSLMLHVDPELADVELAVDEADRTVGRVLQYPMPLVTRSGVVGAPSGATAERGAALMAALADALESLLRAARDERDPEL